jgi:hypothetical protein
MRVSKVGGMGWTIMDLILRQGIYRLPIRPSPSRNPLRERTLSGKIHVDKHEITFLTYLISLYLMV